VTLRWGILGTGGIARQFTRDLLLTGHAVTAVGSRTRENAERFGALFGLDAAHGSYESLVADPSVDIVYVATPHPWHYPHATLALNAGKHALVEKPFTLNATEAHRLVTLAADRGLLVLEAMWTRWLPHMVRLREIVAAGTIGDIRSMSADHTQLLPSDPGHRLNALELGGGALLDLGVYPVSFASQLFGAPQSIQAMATFKETGADAQVAAIFRYADGQIATTYSASTTRGPNVAAVLGTDGRIEIDSIWYAPTGLRVYDGAGTLIQDSRPAVEGRGMQFQAAEAERLISEGRIASAILPPEETVAIMTTLDQIREQIGLRYPAELEAVGALPVPCLCREAVARTMARPGSGQVGRSSSRKPTFNVTWKWQRWFSSIRPRTPLTSNQSRLCRVLAARPIAPLIASSMLSVEDPTISLTE
jgi:predicted dehydrogenase